VVHTAEAAVPVPDKCTFTEKMLDDLFGKTKCKPPPKCEFEARHCPRARKFCAYSKVRRLGGVEETVECAGNNCNATYYSIPTVGWYDRTKEEGNRYVVANIHAIKRMRLEELSWTKDGDQFVKKQGKMSDAANFAASSQAAEQRCTITDTMIKDTCGDEVCTPPTPCGDKLQCPALPTRHTSDGAELQCRWVPQSTLACTDDCHLNSESPCAAPAGSGSRCYAKILRNRTVDGPLGPQLLGCPEVGGEQTQHCKPNVTATWYGVSHAARFYSQNTFLSHGGVLNDEAKRSDAVCSFTLNDVTAKCGVQVCKAVAFKHMDKDVATGTQHGEIKVVDCGEVTTQACKSGVRQWREVNGAKCPTNTCQDLVASKCYDINGDHKVDASDATIIFTAATVPAEFGGVDLVKEYLQKQSVVKEGLDSTARAYHERTTTCRDRKFYSFTSNFAAPLDRFDLVALYIAVTIPKDFSRDTFLVQKIQHNYESNENDAWRTAERTIKAIESRSIVLP
jgi:hypothetical protein